MTTPNPQTVRDFARRAILSTAEDVDFMGIAEQFSDDENWPADEDDAEAMHDAIDAERQTAIVTVSWPDEQDADVRAVAEACADFGDDEGPRGIRQLYARFADRIAALDAKAAG